MRNTTVHMAGQERLTNLQEIRPLIEHMRNTDSFQQFIRGVGFGYAGALYADKSRQLVELVIKADSSEDQLQTSPTAESPLEAVVAQPSWFRGYNHMHDFALSVGAVVGAFSYRDGITQVEMDEILMGAPAPQLGLDSSERGAQL